MRKLLLSLLMVGAFLSTNAQVGEETFRYYDPEATPSYFNTLGTTKMRLIAGISVNKGQVQGTQVTGLKLAYCPFQLGMTDYFIWASTERPVWDSNAFTFKNLEVKQALDYEGLTEVGTLEASFDQAVPIPTSGPLYVGVGFTLPMYPSDEQKSCIPIIANPDRDQFPNGIENSFFLCKAQGYFTTQAHFGALTLTLTLDGHDAISETIESAQESPVKYFDLCGREISEPQHGLFIKRQGSQASKVIL